MNASRTRLGLLILLAAVTSSAWAGDCTPVVRDGWVRMPPMAMPMMAGFGRIENPCSMPVTVVSASSVAFGDVSLHETRVVDGVSRMRALPELRIGAGESAVLKPGGMHLMLMQPGMALKPGSKVVVEFALKGGGKLLGEFVVRSASD
ncbi:copper chaperone PCu(A)C [Lysobacter sp. S4-A87]|uniref:copper chaperone PCu(A)C n=1 Tax=Lysobacter sp. S4-A87 TaxID=2925843 RepID=UPI001F538945|nr:copper chaperone PCu(A)C [Lysobacter sp. S4-A87]UNK49452.1 copper chaperone PCu(A)C [Lysobacter sp. S4-A87]